MGNSVVNCMLPVISVHHGDGRVNYYIAPMSVEDILVEHPDCFVVTIDHGRKNILTPNLELQPGGNYYLLPPPRLFSKEPSSLESCGCCRGCTPLAHSVTTYFQGNLSTKQPSVRFKQEEFHYEAEQREKVLDANGVEIPSLGTLLKPGGLISTREVTVRNLTPRTSFSFQVSKKESTSSRLSFEQEKSEKDGKKADSPKKESPRNSFEKLLLRGSTSITLAKEKWLEDMIRGAENQWRRMQQEFSLKSKKGGSSKSWRSRGKRRSSIKSKLQLRDSWTPSLKKIDESGDDMCSRMMDKGKIRQALRLEIEEMEQLERLEKDEVNKKSLRIKIDDMERQFLLARPDSSIRNMFQCTGSGF